MTVSANPPVAIQELARQLERNKTPLAVVAQSGAYNQLLLARTRMGTVSVLLDRGQWSVSLSYPETEEYFDSAVWRSCIDKTPVSLELVPLEESIEWLLGFLSEPSNRPCRIEDLLSARHRRVFSRLGLPVD